MKLLLLSLHCNDNNNYYQNIGNARLGELLTPYQSEDPNPTTPTHRIKEEKGKTAGDKK